MLYSAIQMLALGVAGICPAPTETPLPQDELQPVTGEQLLMIGDPGSRLEPADLDQAPGCLTLLPTDQARPGLGRGQRNWHALNPDPHEDAQWGLRIPLTGADELCVHWPIQGGSHYSVCQQMDPDNAWDEAVVHDSRLFLAPTYVDPDRLVLVTTRSDFCAGPSYIQIGGVGTLERYERQDIMATGLTYGALFALLAYGLLLLVTIRERALTWFCAHIGSFVTALMLAERLPGQWLGVELGWWTLSGPFLFLGLAIIAGGLFLAEFLRFGKGERIAQWALGAVITVSSGLLFFGTLWSEHIWWAGDTGALLFTLGALAASLYGLWLGRSNSLPLLVGFTFLVSFQLYNGLMRLDLVPSFGLDSFAVLKMGLILAAGSIGFALDRQFSVLRSQRDRASMLAETHQRMALYRAEFNTVTGLPNRQRTLSLIGEAMKRAVRKRTVAILLLDLDSFRNVRQMIGHEGTNEVLRVVATRLRENFSHLGPAGQIDSDEFVLIAELAQGDEETVRSIGEQVGRDIARTMKIEGHRIALTTSIGISLYPETGDNSEQLLRQATTASFAAKEQGGGGIVIYGHGEGAEILHRWHVKDRLIATLEADELDVHFQPIVDLATGDIRAVEALARWHDAELGHIPPSVFIPVAENFGLVDQLGRQIAEKTLDALEAWTKRHGSQIVGTINLSAHQLKKPDLAEWLAAELAARDLDARRIILELTETSLVENLEEARSKLNALRSLGIRIAVDDFGVGYSSLTYLRELPIYALKIDRSFVQRLVDGETRDLIPSMLEMADRLKLRVVAEGVETRDQAERLFRSGCPLAQGFLFARPMSAEQAESLIRSGRRLHYTELADAKTD